MVYLSDNQGFSMRALRRRIGRGTILLHGGGNFGPLYREHHDFREHVIAGAGGVPVVLMPQTLEFGADEFLADAGGFLRRYPNVTALARDERSFALLQEYLGERVSLCPDMALTLDLPSRPRAARELVGIVRRDREAVAERAGDAGVRPWITDWVTSDWHRRDLRLRYWATVRATNASRRLTSTQLYDRNATFVMGRGLDVLASGRVAVSDRLHVHILSVLLDKPHVVLDNSYGKVSAFGRAWTDPAPTAHWASDLADAEQQARALAAVA